MALVRFFRGLGRRPREQSPADQDRDPGLREEHLLAVTLRCLRAAHRAQGNSPALEYVSEHAPELLQEEESAMIRRARHFIQLWQAGTPMTKPSKLHLHDPASADQVKGANFLDNRRRHYRGSRSQPGCGGVCEVCQLMTAAYSGWHETKIHKRKGEFSRRQVLSDETNGWFQLTGLSRCPQARKWAADRRSGPDLRTTRR